LSSNEKPGVFGTLDPFLRPAPFWAARSPTRAFLRFLLAADPFESYHFFLADTPPRVSVAKILAGLAPDLAARGGFALMDRRELPERLKATPYACFHQSDCINFPTHIARLRNAHAPRLFPITGPTHSLSYPDYPAAFLRHLWAGATARDCIIATSAPESGGGGFFDHLRRIRPGRRPGPSLPHAPAWTPGRQDAGPAPRQAGPALRRKLGLPEERP
jgi:hypothetical protein